MTVDSYKVRYANFICKDLRVFHRPKIKKPSLSYFRAPSLKSHPTINLKT